jgi:hypothetical protein
MYSNLFPYLENLFELMPSGIIRLSLDYKITSGVQTDEVSIVFGVEKKIPLDKLSGQYIIPKTLNIENTIYKTDVVEAGLACFIPACHDSFANPPSSTILSHRSKQRPLKGGITLTCQNTNSLTTGTLGLICVDNETDCLVGLTNAHVALGREFYIFASGEYNYNTVDKRVIQKTETNSETPSDTIGNVYRFFPLLHGTVSNEIGGYRNYIDAALVTIRKCDQNGVPTINNQESFKQLNIRYDIPMPFATTEEIDSIFGSNIRLFHAGRTTGPKGTLSCPLKVNSLSPISMEIGDFPYSNHVARYFDIIEFSYVDDTNYPVNGGDSGSVLIADFNGEFKIIGLVFALQILPTPNKAFACRIDNVASMLNISAWDSLPKSYLSYPPRFNTSTTNRFYNITSDKDTKEWDLKFKNHWFAGFANFSGILNAITRPRDLTGVPIPCVNATGRRNNFVEHRMTYNLTSGSGSFMVDGILNPTFRFIRDLNDSATQPPGAPWDLIYGASYTLNINAGGHKVWIKTLPVTGTNYILTSGVTNNGISNGNIVIKIMDYDDNGQLLNTPHTGTLYYVSETDPNMRGKILTYKALDVDEDNDGISNFDEIDGRLGTTSPSNPFISGA